MRSSASAPKRASNCGFALSVWLYSDNNASVPNPIAKDQPKKESPQPKPPNEPKDLKKPEPRDPVTPPSSVWFNRLADATRDHAKVVLVAANLDAMEKLPAVDDLPMNSGMREAGQEVSDGVRTVTLSARKAIDFFARELPMPAFEEQ